MSACAAVAVRRSSTTTSSRLGAGQPQALEQPRVRRDRIGPPHDDDLGAVADVAQRGRARSARLEGEPGRAVEQRAGGIDHRADRLGQRHRGALRLARRPPQPVDERRARVARGSPPPRRARRRARPRGRRRARAAARERARSANHASPSGQVRSRRSSPPSSRDDGRDVVAHQAAAAAVVARSRGAGASGDRIDAPPGRGAPRAARRRAPRGRRARPPGCVPSRRACRSAWPAAIASPGCGTSRMPRAGQSRVSGTRSASVAKSTAFPAATGGSASAAARRPAAGGRRTPPGAPRTSGRRARRRSSRATRSGAG